MKSITDKDVTLPLAKRRELDFVVETLRTGFAASVAKKGHEKYRQGRILKIILFGSYARGDWVEDPVGRYFSDFDILVIVNGEDFTDGADHWMKTAPGCSTRSRPARNCARRSARSTTASTT